MNAVVACRLQPMVAADLPVVARIEAVLQDFPWRESQFADSLQAGHQAWVAVGADQVLGFAVAMPGVDEAELLNIGVAPEGQRQGIGARLLAAVVHWAETVGAQRLLLEVRASNVPALALYQRAGFAEIGRRKAYYPALSGREDARILARELP